VIKVICSNKYVLIEGFFETDLSNCTVKGAIKKIFENSKLKHFQHDILNKYECICLRKNYPNKSVLVYAWQSVCLCLWLYVYPCEFLSVCLFVCMYVCVHVCMYKSMYAYT
jgi:hypothetical protein